MIYLVVETYSEYDTTFKKIIYATEDKDIAIAKQEQSSQIKEAEKKLTKDILDKYTDIYYEDMSEEESKELEKAEQVYYYESYIRTEIITITTDIDINLFI
jgi:hypothetical protein